MQLFFDIDGVLLNFERAFVGFLNRAYGMGLPERYETGSWFFDDLLSREELRSRWQAFLESEDAGRMEPLVEPERFNRLAAGREVHLLTNFPLPYMEKRVANLRALGFAYETLEFAGLHPYRGTVPPTKAEVVERLRGGGKGGKGGDGGRGGSGGRGGAAASGFFIDDHPDNCLDVLQNCAGVEVWLMSRYFNREFSHPEVRRAPDWQILFERLDGTAPEEGGSGTVRSQRLRD